VPAKVIGFIGAKGGVGTTTVAVNVAAALSMFGLDVIAAEITPCARELSLYGRRSKESSMPHPLVRLDEHLTLFHAPSSAVPLWSSDVILRSLDALQRRCQVLILDLSGAAGAETSAAVGRCDEVVLIVDQEFSAIRAAVAKVIWLGSLGLRSASFRVVIAARTPPEGAVAIEETAAALGGAWCAVIPHAPALCLAAERQGKPFVQIDPENAASRAVSRLAASLCRNLVPAGFQYTNAPP
jgi:pilus assembly protein CpaE